MGRISARETIITSGATGEIDAVLVSRGDFILKGSPLVTINPETIEKESARFEEKLTSLYREEKTVREEYDKARIQLDILGGRYYKYLSLFKVGAIARKELERVSGEKEFAESELKKSERLLASITDQLEATKEEIRLKEEEKQNIAISAPADGYVAHLYAWEGGFILRGNEAIAFVNEDAIEMTGKILLSGSLPKKGDKARVFPLRFSVRSIDGLVIRSSDGGGKNMRDASVAIGLSKLSGKDIEAIGKRAIGYIYFH